MGSGFWAQFVKIWAQNMKIRTRFWTTSAFRVSKRVYYELVHEITSVAIHLWIHLCLLWLANFNIMSERS